MLPPGLFLASSDMCMESHQSVSQTWSSLQLSPVGSPLSDLVSYWERPRLPALQVYPPQGFATFVLERGREHTVFSFGTWVFFSPLFILVLIHKTQNSLASPMVTFHEPLPFPSHLAHLLPSTPVSAFGLPKGPALGSMLRLG